MYHFWWGGFLFLFFDWWVIYALHAGKFLKKTPAAQVIGLEFLFLDVSPQPYGIKQIVLHGTKAIPPQTYFATRLNSGH